MANGDPTPRDVVTAGELHTVLDLVASALRAMHDRLEERNLLGSVDEACGVAIDTYAWDPVPTDPGPTCPFPPFDRCRPRLAPGGAPAGGYLGLVLEWLDSAATVSGWLEPGQVIRRPRAGG